MTFFCQEGGKKAEATEETTEVTEETTEVTEETTEVTEDTTEVTEETTEVTEEKAAEEEPPAEETAATEEVTTEETEEVTEVMVEDEEKEKDEVHQNGAVEVDLTEEEENSKIQNGLLFKKKLRCLDLGERSERCASIPMIAGSNLSYGSELLTFHSDLLLTARGSSKQYVSAH
jgi:hypothetical protein